MIVPDAQGGPEFVLLCSATPGDDAQQKQREKWS
jgi:hypothetical protein